MQKKTFLRQMLLAARSGISADTRRQFDAAIGARVINWWTAHPVETLGVYWPIRSEPDLRAVYVELVSRSVRLALPIVVDKEAPLRFVAWIPGDPLVKDAFGVLVPGEGEPTILPDALLVPCVGFNSGRMRLGYGGGFYDRTLATPPRPLSVGIAYACGLSEFASEPHDIGLDVILTEMGEVSAG